MKKPIQQSASPPEIGNNVSNETIPKSYLVMAGMVLSVLVLAGSIIYFLLSSAGKRSLNIRTDESSKSSSQNGTSASNILTAPDANATASAEIKKQDVLDIHALPLGDGKVSTSPKAGYVYSCQQTFNGGGAQHVGSWIHGDTWDSTEKIAVQGQITWPKAQFTISENGTFRFINGNGLPIETKTGTFPIAHTDPAYEIDRNPNEISEQLISFELPLNPKAASSASCVPMGIIGVATNGVAIYNALDADGRDAVAHEVQDICDGHPQGQGEYHYHGPSDCLPNQTENNKLVGYALDGYGIYSMYDAEGKEITNEDLGACHGKTSRIVWNGEEVEMFHYVLTREYPYTIGCFRGTPVKTAMQQNRPNSSGARQPQKGMSPPPGEKAPPPKL